MRRSTGHRIAAYVASLAWASGASIVWAQAPGAFTPTGSMITARSYGISATVLTDGKVLIAGGYTEGLPIWGSAPTAAAEIYDPATGTFSPTGSMNSARALHSATLLLDGRVLIAGGYGFGGSCQTSAELYDPSTGTFTLAGDLTALSVASLRPAGNPGMRPPAGVSAPHISLMNGKILFAGSDGLPAPETYAAVWNPATGTFDPGVGQMSAPRADQAMTLLPDGKALVTGGSSWTTVEPLSWDQDYVVNGGPIMYRICCLSSAELFDPATEQFTVAGSMVAPRAGHTAAVLSSGDVLIVGGTLLSGDVNIATGGIPAGASAELYHPATPIAPPPAAFFTGAVSLGNSVYYLQFPNSNGTVFGYYTFVSSSIFYHPDTGYEGFIPGSASDVYLYDFSSGHWWYTNPNAFPYLYDYTLQTWIYYFPNTTAPGHYTTGPRYFSNLATGHVFSM